ncbi:unnamed protein product [Nippostrongylus brasiliensis]|uniref:BRCT domain-containing protein n=1 Tax=Nippostrongylus brasiliensis TaxID=27835 RepID=A0A0N4YFS5_NIPBR|nr:unnamed protein product [Nippostrongylus brasiliensis]
MNSEENHQRGIKIKNQTRDKNQERIKLDQCKSMHRVVMTEPRREAEANPHQSKYEPSLFLEVGIVTKADVIRQASCAGVSPLGSPRANRAAKPFAVCKYTMANATSIGRVTRNDAKAILHSDHDSDISFSKFGRYVLVQLSCDKVKAGSSDESGSAEKKKGRKPRRAKAAKKKSTKKTPRKKRTPKRRKAKEEAEPPPPPPPKEDNATPKIPKKDNRGRKRVADKAASNSGGLPPTDSGGGKVSKRSSGSATASARGPTAAEEHAEAMECVLDTQPQGGVKGQSAFDTAVQHTPRSGSRARRRSSSRSASRLQIRGQELDLTTPLFMRSFQTVRVEAESEEMVITSNVVIHPMQMTFEERKAELENLVQVRPAVINVKTMDDDGFQEEKTAQNVLIGRKMIVVERKSTLLRSDKDSGLKTSDTRKYNRVAEVQMGPPPEMGGRRTVGVLSVIAENGTTMSGDLYHKRERIVFNIGNVDFDLSDLKKLPDRCEQSSTQKRNVRFDERIFKDESSITIERDTFIDAKNGTLFNSKDPFYVEEKRSYDYEKFFPDGSLAWIGSAFWFRKPLVLAPK